MNKYFLLLVGAVMIGMGVTFFRPHHVSAGAIAASLSGVAPAYIADDIEFRCSIGWTLVQHQWISPQGAPAATTANVAWGAMFIPMQLNFITYRCRPGSSVNMGSFLIVNTNPNIPPLNGLVGDMPYAGVGQYQSWALLNFNYTNGAPYTTSGGVAITIGTKGTLTRPSGSSCAITGAPGDYGGPVANPHDFGRCAIEYDPFTFFISVGPKPTPFNASPGASATITGGTVDNPTKVTFGATATSTAPTTPTIRLFRTFTKNGATYPPTPANATNDVVANSSGAPAPNVDMLISGAAVGDRYCTTVMANPDSGNFYSDGTQSPGPGGGGWTPPVTACVTVAAAPYFKVYGGDVSAGGSFDAGSCTQDPSAGVLSWNLNGAPNYGGSGTEFAAQAMANISGFATAQASNTGDGLSFANSVNNVPASGQFGGQLGAGGIPCAYDYYGKQPGTATSLAAKLACMTAKIPGSVPATSTPSLSNAGTCDTRINNLVTSGSVYSVDVSSSGGLWISGTGPPLNPGQDFTMYVKGNVYITNNITYNPNGWSMGRVPSFRLIAQGNIYVDSSVTQLDGLYVAQPDAVGGGGTIYDCAGGPNKLFVSQPVDVTFYAKCGGGGQPLVVNGAFIANTTKLWRTTGTYSQSGTDSQGAGACDSPGSCGTKAGEVFNYSPELWLTQAATTQTRYDTVTSLPPIL